MDRGAWRVCSPWGRKKTDKDTTEPVVLGDLLHPSLFWCPASLEGIERDPDRPFSMTALPGIFASSEMVPAPFWKGDTRLPGRV